MISLNLIRFLFVLTAFNSIVKSEIIQSDIKVIEREKRVVGTFPYNSATGVRQTYFILWHFFYYFFYRF